MTGVHLRAVHGEIPVETIQVGDEVLVLRDGVETPEAVKWVGYSYTDLARHVFPEQAAPIRIRSNAIADNQPSRDLFLSPEHCLIIDGLCVPVKLLVNGGTITSERDHAPFTYYHIELERHGILLAENTPAESYLDTGDRSLFDNADEPRQLHPSFAVNANAERWLTDACAPLVRTADQLEPIWRRIAERSEQLGFPIPAVKTVNEPDVHILADGQRIQPASHRDFRYVFAIPAGVSTVSLVSRVCIPADLLVRNLGDQRRLGVSVNWIAIRSNNNEAILTADHPSLESGWHDAERSAAAMWRWTNGVAIIPWENVIGPAVVTVRCRPIDQYPLYDEKMALIA